MEAGPISGLGLTFAGQVSGAPGRSMWGLLCVLYVRACAGRDHRVSTVAEHYAPDCGTIGRWIKWSWEVEAGLHVNA